MVGEEPDDLAAESGEELGVGDRPRTGGLSFDVVKEDQVDVRAVVQLLAAVLAERQDDEPRGLTIASASWGAWRSSVCWRARR